MAKVFILKIFAIFFILSIKLKYLLPKLKSTKMQGFSLVSVAFMIGFSANSQSYKKIHQEAIVCDTHNDIISNLHRKGL